MDLSNLSAEDLQAISTGDMSKVSNEGLLHLSGNPGRPQMAIRDPNEVDSVTGQTRGQMESELGKFNDSNSGVGSKLLGALTSPFVRDALHMGGTAGRAVGIGGLQGPAFLGDVAALPLTAADKAMDSFRSPTLSETITGKKQIPWMPLTNKVNQLDEAISSPENTAQSAPGRIASAITRAASGALITGGLGELGAASQAAQSSPMLAKIAQFLANPKGQAIAAGTGAAAGGTTREMGGGPVAQTVATLAGAMAPGTTANLAQRAIGVPTPAAKTLLDKGVELTPGQMKPGGWYSQLEDATQDWPIIGPSVKQAKGNAEAQTREAWLLDAAAPNAKIQPTGDLQKTLSNVGDSFDVPYANLGGYPLKLQSGQPVIMNQGTNTPISSAMDAAINDKAILATPQTRQMANDFLQNQLQKIPKNSEDIINMRSAIRSKIRSINPRSVDDQALKDILENAEGVTTQVLTSQLPPNLLKELKGIDAQYAKYNIASDAMAAAKDRPDGFTFSQASNAAASSAKATIGKKQYAQGEGFMRDIPAAAQNVFRQTPPTGARLISHLAGIPMLPLIGGGTLTNAGRTMFANNKINPIQLPVAGLSSAFAQEPQNENALMEAIKQRQQQRAK